MKYLSILLLLISQLSFSQDKVWNLTFSIIDTSTSKQQQAFQIYNWMIRNISYDLDAYLKNNSQSHTSFETLERKKGLCFEYANLFNDMCQSVGIESCLVFGYTKNVDYERGDPFFRADHCWNAVHTDSAWLIIDPTWGSGFIARRVGRTDFIKSIFKKTSPVNRRYVFVKSPTDRYFNFHYNTSKPTHLPLDPKWQLYPYPITLNEFGSDSIPVIQRADNYVATGLENTINLSLSRQTLIEGINGFDFNPNNHFDIAKGYYSICDRDYKTQNISAKNYEEARYQLTNLNLSYTHIKRYHIEIDSFISSKIERIKSSIKQNEKIRESIRADYKKSKKKLNSRFENVFKRDKTLNSKINIYEFRKKILKQKSLDQVLKLKYSPFFALYETFQYIKINQTVEETKTGCDSLHILLDSCIRSINLLLEHDFIINNRIYQSTDSLRVLLEGFTKVIQSEDNRELFPYFSQIGSVYQRLQYLLKEKYANKSNFNRNYLTALRISGKIVEELQTGLSTVKNYYRSSVNNVHAYQLFEELQNLALEQYKISRELTLLALSINSNQTDFYNSFLFRMKAIKTSSQKSQTYFDNYLEFSLEKQQRLLTRELSLCKQIEKSAKNDLTLLQNKLDAFEKSRRN